MILNFKHIYMYIYFQIIDCQVRYLCTPMKNSVKIPQYY